MTNSDRISLMLDSMIIAVDEGFSYDGIVSIPETGLEDMEHPPRLVVWLHEGLNLLWKTVKVFVFQKQESNRPELSPSPPFQASEPKPEPSLRDSGISELKVSEDTAQKEHTGSEQGRLEAEADEGGPQASPIGDTSGTVEEGRPENDQQGKQLEPRKKREGESSGEENQGSLNLQPRKRVEGAHPREKVDEQRPPAGTHPEKQPRKK